MSDATFDANSPKASQKDIRDLSGNAPILELRQVRAGYGKTEILHGIDLAIGAGQSLCLVGPNGAGKSTVLHAIFGFAKVKDGAILIRNQNVTQFSSNDKLAKAKVAYILQDSSIFPDMTVEENLYMGGYLLNDTTKVKRAAENILDEYPRLAARRKERAQVLSGGERRLLEITRSLIMDPDILLIDEPSIGLEPRMIDEVFALLTALRDEQGKTIILVEQNARKGLKFADLGYVLVAGRVAIAATADTLLDNPEIGRLFLGDSAQNT